MKSPNYAGAKGLPRGFDFIVSLGGLILCLPLLVVSALAVALTSRGGVLFRQKRVGLGGETFVIYKLRTMRAAGAAPPGGGGRGSGT